VGGWVVTGVSRGGWYFNPSALYDHSSFSALFESDTDHQYSSSLHVQDFDCIRQALVGGLVGHSWDSFDFQAGTQAGTADWKPKHWRKVTMAGA
jgi:hypothetical protein